MRDIILLSSLLALAGCQASQPMPRAQMTVTPRSFVKPAPAKQPTDDAATQQWLSQARGRQRADASQQAAPSADVAPAALQAHPSPAPQSPATQSPVGQPQAPPPQPTQSQTNEEATRAWLDRTIEERRNANPPVP